MPDMVGETCLMYAVRCGGVECVEVLLDQCADPNVVNLQRNTALHLACKRVHGPCIEMLIRYGAEVNRVNDAHQLPAQMADPAQQAPLSQWMVGLVKFHVCTLWVSADNRVPSQQRAEFRRSFDAMDIGNDCRTVDDGRLFSELSVTPA